MEISKNILSRLDKLKEIQSLSSKEVYVTVYGKYNHGKSSLLNALTEHQNQFKVADKRETTKISTFLQNGINYNDTPGLDADIQGVDDSIANNMLDKSDILLFVHSLKEGELDKKELDFITQNIKAKHIIMVLTQLDQISDDTVFNMIQNQLKNFKTEFFQVSSIRAFHQNEKIRAKSNISSLNNRILSMKSGALFSRKSKIIELSNEILKIIDGELPKFKSKKSEIENEISGLEVEFSQDRDSIQNKQNEIDKV